MNRPNFVRKAVRTRRLHVEALETRTLLSVVCDHGVSLLTIEGSPANDTIKVTAIRNSADFVKKIAIRVNGKGARACSGVYRLVINAGDGNDHVTVERLWSIYPELQVSGGAGDDNLRSVKSSAVLSGDAGDDTLQGDVFDDFLHGGDGDDLLLGGEWHDYLLGENGDDTVYGGEGDDWIEGGAGADSLFGEMGNDFLQGFEGDHRILGGAGRDEIDGGTGRDVMDGGLDFDIIHDESPEELGDVATNGVAFLHGEYLRWAELRGGAGSVDVEFTRLAGSGSQYRVDLQVTVHYLDDGTYDIVLDGGLIGRLRVTNRSGQFRSSTTSPSLESRLTETIESLRPGSNIQIGDVLTGVIR